MRNEHRWHFRYWRYLEWLCFRMPCTQPTGLACTFICTHEGEVISIPDGSYCVLTVARLMRNTRVEGIVSRDRDLLELTRRDWLQRLPFRALHDLRFEDQCDRAPKAPGQFEDGAFEELRPTLQVGAQIHLIRTRIQVSFGWCVRIDVHLRSYGKIRCFADLEVHPLRRATYELHGNGTSALIVSRGFASDDSAILRAARCRSSRLRCVRGSSAGLCERCRNERRQCIHVVGAGPRRRRDDG
jgi:hypothetical protein